MLLYFLPKNKREEKKMRIEIREINFGELVDMLRLGAGARYSSVLDPDLEPELEDYYLLVPAAGSNLKVRKRRGRKPLTVNIRDETFLLCREEDISSLSLRSEGLSLSARPLKAGGWKVVAEERVCAPYVGYADVSASLFWETVSDIARSRSLLLTEAG